MIVIVILFNKFQDFMVIINYYLASLLCNTACDVGIEFFFRKVYFIKLIIFRRVKIILEKLNF
jgi:hypothetical protein